MGDARPEPVFLDATVVSNFASTAATGYLAAVLAEPVVVPEVREEIERGLSAGHDYLSAAVGSFGDELPLREVPTDVEGAGVRERLDPGEAESLLGAIAFEGTLATDDLAARRVADGRGVPVTGSIGLLVLGVEEGRIDASTADDWLDVWRERRGYYAPVESVAEVLEDE